MKYNLSEIMKRAWKIYRKYRGISFGEALHRSWISEKAKAENERRIENAKMLAGVSEIVKTWSGWKEAGFKVIHGSKALFGADLIYGSKGDNEIYKARFFGESQVEACG